MARKTAYNPGDTPVVIDAEGHVLGGHEWGEVDPSDDAVSGALDAGRLVLVDTPDDGKQTSRAKRGASEEA